MPQQQLLRELLRRGFESLSRGQIREAASCCEQALAIKADLPQAHFLVGLTALEGKDRKTAFQAFGSVTRLDPKHAAAWAQLARLFMGEGQVIRADAALAEAAGANSQDPMVLDLMGTVYSLMGEYEIAHQYFESACEKQPRHPPFLLNLANNHIYFGQTDAALILFKKILELQPNSPQAHWALSAAKKVDDAEHIEQMRALLETHQTNDRARAFYYYAMGKEYEDLENWAPAFEAFSAGAKARRATVEFDEAGEQAMFEFLEAEFTHDWLEKGQAGCDEPGPIFVLGQPRTGTTLIERVISSHSQVHSAGELQQLGLAVRRLSDYRDPKRFSVEFFQAAKGVDRKKMGEVYLETVQKMRGDTPFFVDKLPQNYLMLPLILAALPNAKIIHLTRDPMDACFASFKQLFADAYLHSYEQTEMARHHARYRRLMAVWRDRFADRFLDVSYEATVKDLDAGARRLIGFLGLDWEDACLDFHAQGAAVSTASAVQVREPAHTRSVGRWKRYQRQLQPMQEALAAEGIKIDA